MTVQTHTAWQYRNPADLIGRRCIALTGMDVTLDGPLDLIRLSPVHAVLKYRGIGLHVIDCDLRHHTRHHRHMHGARRMRKRVGAFNASA